MAFDKGKNLSSIPLQNYAPMGLDLMEELVQEKGLIPFCSVYHQFLGRNVSIQS